MNVSFTDGYNYFIEHSKAYVGTEVASMLNQPYLDKIEREIQRLADAINSYKGNRNPNLHGYLAEEWHTHTFNIDAAAKRTVESTRVLSDEVHNLGSVDIEASFGKEFSLKYYKNGSLSAYAQAVSLEDMYRICIENILMVKIILSLGKNIYYHMGLILIRI